jgi:chemotaxis protein methyltransferase CheR
MSAEKDSTVPHSHIEIDENEIFSFFARFIEKEIGIIYADHNSYQLRNRLEEICKLVGERDLESLYLRGKKEISGPFRQLLLDIATNNETSFFRDPKVFKSIEDIVLPGLLKIYRDNERFRIWSAASSTGQEALSVAILLEEAKRKLNKSFDFEIMASDISERALVKAKEGIYSQLEVQRGLPAALMIKYFSKIDNERWAAKPEIRKRVEFRHQNLKDPLLKLGKFGLILCRNVLIYHNVQGKIEILDRLAEQLLPGGFLIMGSGESMIGLSQRFQQVGVDGAVIYRRKDLDIVAA